MGNVGTKMRTTWGMISQREEIQALSIAAPFPRRASCQLAQYWSWMRESSLGNPSLPLNHDFHFLKTRQHNPDLGIKWGDIWKVPQSTRHLITIRFPSGLTSGFICQEARAFPLAGVSNLHSTRCLQPRMAVNADQHKIVNLLKTLWDFFCDHLLQCI